MANASKVWAGLSTNQRRDLLKVVWRPGSSLIDLEAKLKWNKLLPSTQGKLIVALAGYDARPKRVEKTSRDTEGESR